MATTVQLNEITCPHCQKKYGINEIDYDFLKNEGEHVFYCDGCDKEFHFKTEKKYEFTIES